MTVVRLGPTQWGHDDETTSRRRFGIIMMLLLHNVSTGHSSIEIKTWISNYVHILFTNELYITQMFDSRNSLIVITHFPCYWTIVRRIHWVPVISHSRVNNTVFDVLFDDSLNKLLKNDPISGDLRRYDAHMWRHCSDTAATKQDTIKPWPYFTGYSVVEHVVLVAITGINVLVLYL